MILFDKIKMNDLILAFREVFKLSQNILDIPSRYSGFS